MTTTSFLAHQPMHHTKKCSKQKISHGSLCSNLVKAVSTDCNYNSNNTCTSASSDNFMYKANSRNHPSLFYDSFLESDFKDHARRKGSHSSNPGLTISSAPNHLSPQNERQLFGNTFRSKALSICSLWKSTETIKQENTTRQYRSFRRLFRRIVSRFRRKKLFSSRNHVEPISLEAMTDFYQEHSPGYEIYVSGNPYTHMSNENSGCGVFIGEVPVSNQTYPKQSVIDFGVDTKNDIYHEIHNLRDLAISNMPEILNDCFDRNTTTLCDRKLYFEYLLNELNDILDNESIVYESILGMEIHIPTQSYYHKLSRLRIGNIVEQIEL